MMVMEEQFVEAIDIISDKLGIAATKVFEIFVGAQAVIGMLMIVKCVVMFTLAVLTYLITMKVLSGYYTYSAAVRNMKKQDDENEDAKAFIFVVPIMISVFSIVLWGIITSIIMEGILKMMCPEYSAISEIINLIL